MASKVHHTKIINTGTKKNIYSLKSLYAIIILAVLTIIFFHKIIFQKAYFWNDFVDIFYINRSFAAVNMAKGIIPLWNPYVFTGIPFVGEVFYPFHLLLTFFVSKGQLNFIYLEYLIVLHFFLSGLFTFLFCKSLHLNIISSLFAGIIFMFSGFMVCHVIHETIITTVIWLPLILLLYNRIFELNRWLDVFLVSLVYGIMILGGHPQIILYISFIVLLFYIYNSVLLFFKSKYRFNSYFIELTIKAGIPIVLGIMIGSIQLLPSFELAKISERASIGYEESLDGSIGYNDLVTILFPKIYGSANAANMNPEFNDDKLVKYWEKEYNYWETSLYIGIIAFFLSLYGIAANLKNKIAVFMFLLFLCSLMFILGDNFFFYKLFYNYFPGFNKFRMIARFGFAFDFALAVLAAYGLEKMFIHRKSPNIKLFNIILICIFSVLSIIWLLLELNQLRFLSSSFINNEYYYNTANQVGIGLIFLLIFILIITLQKRIIMKHSALLLLFIICFIDLYIYGENQNNDKQNPADKFQNRDIAQLIKKEYNSGLFRINNNASNLNFAEKNQGMLDEVFFTEGNNPLQIKKRFPPVYENELLNVKYIIIPKRIGDVPVYKNPNMMPRAWISFRPVIISDDSMVINFMRSGIYDYRNMVVLNDLPDIPIKDTVVTPYKCNITNYQIDRIDIETRTDKPAILVLSEVFHENWKVYVNGSEKKMLIANYCLRGVAIDKGKSNVSFVYSDKELYLGSFLCLISLCISIAGISIGSYYEKKNKKRE